MVKMIILFFCVIVTDNILHCQMIQKNELKYNYEIRHVTVKCILFLKCLSMQLGMMHFFFFLYTKTSVVYP